MSGRVYEGESRGRGGFRRGGYSGRGRNFGDDRNNGWKQRDHENRNGSGDDDWEENSQRNGHQDRYNSGRRNGGDFESENRDYQRSQGNPGRRDYSDSGRRTYENSTMRTFENSDRRNHENPDRRNYENSDRRNYENSDRRNYDSRRGNESGRDERNDFKENDEKPKERYIPEDPSEKREDIFGSGISSGLNFAKYSNIDVKVSGTGVVNPIQTFEDCNFRKIVYENLISSGYEVPTPIQKYAFPFIMKKRDVMACAQTGSGKTAAFLVPIINSLLEENLASDNDDCVKPRVVIMTPVRELTQQIFHEARKFAYGSVLRIGRAYGGTVCYDQAQRLKGSHIIVATPGRLNDFVARGKVSFSSVKYLVLDEADRMLDMGFLPAIKTMLDHHSMPSSEKRVTLMFSATFPEEIQVLAADYMNNYLFIAVGIVGSACSDVEQVIIQVPRYQKQEKLKEILYESQEEKDKYLTLIFVETKRTADYIATLLSENKFPTTSIHGDRLQSQRDAALRDFQSGRKPILVATAVAARGLDIKNVMHVINYDMPKSIDEYVHRIGRTGRVGNRGKATSFFDLDNDRNLAGDLVKILQQSGNEVPSFILETAGTRNYSEDMLEDQSFGGTDARKVENWEECGFENVKSIRGAQEEEVEW